jgi:hypothetical protein
MGIRYWTVRQRLGAFAAALVAVFALGYGVGGAVGPLDEPEPPPPHDAPAPTTTITHRGAHS